MRCKRYGIRSWTWRSSTLRACHLRHHWRQAGSRASPQPYTTLIWCWLCRTLRRKDRASPKDDGWEKHRTWADISGTRPGKEQSGSSHTPVPTERPGWGERLEDETPDYEEQIFWEPPDSDSDSERQQISAATARVVQEAFSQTMTPPRVVYMRSKLGSHGVRNTNCPLWYWLYLCVNQQVSEVTLQMVYSADVNTFYNQQLSEITLQRVHERLYPADVNALHYWHSSLY